ncbi:hypothetical protein KKF84_02540 [Myxococcota bacterium]|nr:hypothetical protein [Myxococcota bacterium]MBU1534167.1 hypothetical protein [Myxococcota bacterium]
MKFSFFNVISAISLLVSVNGGLGCSSLTPDPVGKLAKPLRCSLPSQLKLSEKVNIIGVFTTWDLKSQVQMSRFDKVRPFFGKKVGISYVFIDHDSRMVDGWVSLNKPIFPVMYNPRFMLCGKRVNRVPITLILGASGKICYSYQGAVTSKMLHSQIVDALKNCK